MAEKDAGDTPETDKGKPKPRIPKPLNGEKKRRKTRVSKATRWKAGHKILSRLANQALGELEDSERFTADEIEACRLVLPYLVPQIREEDTEGDTGMTVRIVHQQASGGDRSTQ